MRLDPEFGDLRDLPDDLAARVAALMALNAREEFPEDDPVPLDWTVRRWRTAPGFHRERAVLAWEGETLAGLGLLTFDDLTWDRDLARAFVLVAPGYRRRRLGLRLLARVVAEGARYGRVRFGAGSNDRQPAGEALLRRVAARPGLDVHTSQLDLRTLDRALLDAWVRDGRERARGYEVLVVRGEWPPELSPAMVELTRVMNTAPTGSLDVEPHEFTVEQVEEHDRQRAALGVIGFTAVAREVRAGELAGYTELSWGPGRPGIAFQGDTGVRPEHRGHGLGRWLKAANLLAFLAEVPQARFVRTHNADSNGPMLAINSAMGFRPHIARTEWQFDALGVPDLQEPEPAIAPA